MRISDWSSDVCSSDLGCFASLIYISTYIYERTIGPWNKIAPAGRGTRRCCRENLSRRRTEFPAALLSLFPAAHGARFGIGRRVCRGARLYSACCHRSEEHTSELQSLMRISYAVFCLKKKNNNKYIQCQ